MRKTSRLILLVVCMGMSVSAAGISELELQKLEKFSFEPKLPTDTLNKVFIDFNVSQTSKIENTPPISITEFRSQLKQHFAWQLNPKWQLGLDSFKASPINKQVISWPKSTEPKENRTSSQKGYGVGIRMKLD